MRLVKELLAQNALTIGSIGDKEARIAAAIYAYWFAPEVHAAHLAFAARGRRHVSALLKHVGGLPSGVACDRCEAELVYGGRSAVA